MSVREKLERLAHKYRSLAKLRARRDELEGQGRDGFSPEELETRRQAFRLLAHEFPGALRELDTSTGRTLAAKADAVEAELAALAADETLAAPARAWVRVVVDYHATLRDMLAAKLWLARRVGKGGLITGDIAAEALRRWPYDRAFLGLLHHPPGGRLHPLVWRELEARHGVSREELKEMIFGDQR